jgi:hypothetical protein
MYPSSWNSNVSTPGDKNHKPQNTIRFSLPQTGGNQMLLRAYNIRNLQ